MSTQVPSRSGNSRSGKRDPGRGPAPGPPGPGPAAPGASPAHRSGTAPEREPESGSSLRHFVREHRRSLLGLVGVGVAVIFVFAVLPQLAGFGKSLHRLRYGNKVWLAAGIGLETLSLGGYMALFRMTFSGDGVRIRWGSSYQITMAGVVATKVLAAGGAGGIALTVWALRAAGLSARSVARRMTSFEILLYAVFMIALVMSGGGLATGILPGHSHSALAVLAAGFGAVVILLALGLAAGAEAAQRRISALAARVKRGRGVLEKLAAVPRTLDDGFHTTWEILRHPSIGLLGAVLYWAFDIATLWAAFQAFGASPEISVVVLAYFVGQLANALPIPGGIGGVEGGMIGSLIACGVSGSTAVLAVLAYRLISFWLPVLPGTFAYLRLRSAVAKWNEAGGEANAEEAAEHA